MVILRKWLVQSGSLGSLNVMPIKKIREQTEHSFTLSFFKLSLDFGLDFKIGLGLSLWLSSGLGLGIG